MDQQQQMSRPPGSEPVARDHWLITEQSGREVLRSLIEQWLDHNGWSLAVTSRLAELALLARSSEPIPEWVAGMSLQAGQWVKHRGHVWEAIGTPASEPADDVPGWREVSLTSRLHSSGLNLFLRRKSRSLASTFFLELGRLNEWVAAVQAGKQAAPTDQRLRDCVASAHVLRDQQGVFGPEELLSIAISRLTPEPLVKKQAAAEQERPPECISGRTLRKAAGVLVGIARRLALLPRIARADGVYIHLQVCPLGPAWLEWLTCRLARAWAPSLGDFRLGQLVADLRLGPRLEALAAQHCPPKRRRFHCALYDALAAALVLRALCALEGRSQATLAQLVRDSVSAPAANDLMQGELGL
jgi:hypothetical protein